MKSHLVVESNGLVLGYIEITIGHEPAPYGQHLHITTLQLHKDSDNQEALASCVIAICPTNGTSHAHSTYFCCK